MTALVRNPWPTVVLAGGRENSHRQIFNHLADERGIYAKYFWEASEPVPKKVPKDVDMVLLLMDSIHSPFKVEVKEVCHKQGILLVPTTRHWTDIAATLTRMNYYEERAFGDEIKQYDAARALPAPKPQKQLPEPKKQEAKPAASSEVLVTKPAPPIVLVPEVHNISIRDIVEMLDWKGMSMMAYTMRIQRAIKDLMITPEKASSPTGGRPGPRFTEKQAESIIDWLQRNGFNKERKANYGQQKQLLTKKQEELRALCRRIRQLAPEVGAENVQITKDSAKIKWAVTATVEEEITD